VCAVLSSLFFIVYINWVVDGSVTLGVCGINLLPIANHFVFLVTSEQGLQRALDWFSAARDQERSKRSTEKTDVLSLSRNPTVHCSSRSTSSKTLRWYSRATESRTTRLINGFCKANAVLHELYHSVVTKRGLSNTAKVSALKSVFVAISPMILSND